MPKQMSVPDYDKAVSEMAQSNHLWISAFSCIRPTTETKIMIGEWVLRMLADKDNLLPSSSITSDNKTVREIAELTPMLYLSVNKS